MDELGLTNRLLEAIRREAAALYARVETLGGRHDAISRHLVEDATARLQVLMPWITRLEAETAAPD